jgi:pyruvate dehydrogenase E1 component alpha subunit
MTVGSLQSAPPDPALGLLPSPEVVRFLNPDGTPADARYDYTEPDASLLLDTYRHLVRGRRFDRQATALTKQGRLAVYPSSNGQEACQVGAVLALRPSDWLFPTYRECVALVTRGVDPVEALSLLRGDWHAGYDPYAHAASIQCTPLATQTLHAVGFAYAAKRKGEDTVALAFIGDGATSEGDFHEAMNFAAVFKAPVVFFVQNNQYAISVPLSRQTQAPSLAHKAVGYGMPGERVDGNDPAAVLAVVAAAAERARSGGGPTLIEAMTYRMDSHTNADDATRYREADEVNAWADRDPVARLEAHLRDRGVLDDVEVERIATEAEDFAAALRERMNADPVLDPDALFAHVYSEMTPQLRAQREMLRAELAAHEEA